MHRTVVGIEITGCENQLVCRRLRQTHDDRHAVELNADADGSTHEHSRKVAFLRQAAGEFQRRIIEYFRTIHDSLKDFVNGQVE